MGLIKASFGSVGGTLADHWKEFFYCDSLSSDVLIKKGERRTSRRSSNTKGNDNIISNGSVIAVADGQCMMIVDQGKVVEVSAEPGEFTYDASSEPSVFEGPLGKSFKDSFLTIGRRFAFGADTGKDQRVYYVNIKELLDNKFGTPNPIPFRVVDKNLGLDLDVSVRCSGLYSYKISDPVKFYENVAGNIENEYLREEISQQLKSEFISALQPAFASLSALEIRPNQMIAHTMELEAALNSALTAKWSDLRGLEVVSVALSSVTLPEEDADMLKEAQRVAILRDPSMAAAALAGAQAEAMKNAASNESGAMNGFMGMGMAMNAGGNLAGLFQQSANRENSDKVKNDEEEKTKNSWKCSCGQINTGNFCENCGKKKPQKGWVCSCGHINLGRFCTECGKKKPEGEPLYRCDKCHWEPEDPKNPPKFCPQCGDRFDDSDKI